MKDLARSEKLLPVIEGGEMEALDIQSHRYDVRHTGRTRDRHDTLKDVSCLSATERALSISDSDHLSSSSNERMSTMMRAAPAVTRQGREHLDLEITSYPSTLSLTFMYCEYEQPLYSYIELRPFDYVLVSDVQKLDRIAT